MARLNDDAQWIILMGFIVSFSLFFLALILNQSTVVGQTTAESVSEFPKEDIRGVRDVALQSLFMDDDIVHKNMTRVQNDIRVLAITRQNAVVEIDPLTAWPGGGGQSFYTNIHYNNGVSEYHELFTFPYIPESDRL